MGKIPFRDDAPLIHFFLVDWTDLLDISKYSEEQLRKDLKKYGGVKPPREFVLVDRAAIGLGSVFMHLKAELNWHEKFEELIKNFDEKKVITSQKKLLL